MGGLVSKLIDYELIVLLTRERFSLYETFFFGEREFQIQRGGIREVWHYKRSRRWAATCWMDSSAPRKISSEEYQAINFLKDQKVITRLPHHPKPALHNQNQQKRQLYGKPMRS